MKFEMVISARDGSRAELILDQNILRVFDYSKRHLYSFNTSSNEQNGRLIYETSIVFSPKWQAITEFLESQDWHEYYDQPVQNYLASWGIIYENGSNEIVAGGQSSYPTGFKKLIKLINELIADSKFKLEI